MPKSAFITGIAGQDGSYLANFLLKKKYIVIGLANELTGRHLHRLNFFGITDRIKLIKGDITDKELMRSIIKQYHPSELYNLAGVSGVVESWKNPAETFRINTVAVIELLDAVRIHSRHTHFFQASSAEIYGQLTKPITEKTTTFQPLNPYGISKLAAHLSVQNYRKQYDLFVVSGILFNHESPLRDNRFVSNIIAHGVARIAKGLSSTIELGNIWAERDFGFAGDFVEAMWLILNNKRPEDFVVCTGQTFSIAKFIQTAFASVGISNWQDYVRTVPSLIRKQEIKKMQGKSSRIKKMLGWKPHVTFQQLVKIMVDFELSDISDTE